MFKRILIWVMILFSLSPSWASASEKITCDCHVVPCVCFIQQGDEGPFVSAVIRLLKEKGYCGPKQKISIFDEGVLDGVMALQKEFGLEETGMLDDETLTALIFGMLPEELDGAEPLSKGDLNWVPTDGGDQRHRLPTCSSMLTPRKVSIRNAEALGFPACQTCNKDKALAQEELPDENEISEND